MIFISDQDIAQDKYLDEVAQNEGLNKLLEMRLVEEGQRELLNKHSGMNSKPVKTKDSGYRYNCEFDDDIISLPIYYDPTNPITKITAKQITTGIFDKRIDKTIKVMEKNNKEYEVKPFCIYITSDAGIYVMYPDANSVTRSNGWNTLGSYTVQQGSNRTAEIHAYRDEFN